MSLVVHLPAIRCIHRDWRCANVHCETRAQIKIDECNEKSPVRRCHCRLDWLVFPFLALAWIESPRRKVEWREVFHFQPGPDQTIGTPVGSWLNEKENHITTNRDTFLAEGVIGNFWLITEGDAPGPHSFDISIEGVSVSTLVFYLEPPAKTAR
jgi:hypothetical protein